MHSRTTMYCPSCQANNVYNKLKLQQINLTVAVYLCEDKSCPYPKGYDWIEVKRSLDELLSEKQHSTGDSDLDNWLDEAFEREISNVNIICKKVTTECNSDKFLAEIFKELESTMNNMINIENEPENLPCIKDIQPITRQENMNDSLSSSNYLESVFNFENENFVMNYKNS